MTGVLANISARAESFDLRRRPGVYLLVRDDRIVYVGKSRHIDARIWNHVDANEKDFDRALWFRVAESKLGLYEAALIRALKPQYNDVYPAHDPAHERVLAEFDLVHLLDTQTPARKPDAKGGAEPGIVGTNIRTRRRALRLSQSEFANRLGVTQAAVSRWESGGIEVPLSRLAEVAAVLSTTALELAQ